MTLSMFSLIRLFTLMQVNFRMILIAEKETVYKDFPTPLINRLEKHFVVTSTILTEPQKEVVNRLITWAKEFTTITIFDDM